MTEKSFFAGLGGQGIISLGQIWVYCAMQEGREVTCFPSYGAEKRGGMAHISVIVSDEEIASPLVRVPDSVLVMNPGSLPLCEGMLKPGGLMLINSSLVGEGPRREDIRVARIQAQHAAEQLGNIRVANMVVLGALAKLTGALGLTNLEAILKKFFPPDKHGFIPLNRAAVQMGYEAVECI
ncbi:MAG: 2-oxoacid:acceptor oxidoreductase family protein [Treponema sp.]|jgi:2-oxoglutarate ferredoxin oxidoreductase subunit gamma|nr:2-oxoacid:acceptor oxidoreductase family protein [Treponema sp.]